MKRVRAVTGENVTEYAANLERAYQELDGLDLVISQVAPMQTVIEYDEPDEPGPDDGGGEYAIQLTDGGKIITVSLLVGDYEGRYCCECENLEWGRGCPYRSGRVAQMDQACPMFNVVIERR